MFVSCLAQILLLVLIAFFALMAILLYPDGGSAWKICAGIAGLFFLWLVKDRKRRMKPKEKGVKSAKQYRVKSTSSSERSEREEAWDDFLDFTLEEEIAPAMLQDVFECCACGKSLPTHRALAFAFSYERFVDEGSVNHDYTFDGILCKDCLASIRKMKSLNATKYFFIPKEFLRVDPDAPVKKPRKAKTP